MKKCNLLSVLAAAAAAGILMVMPVYAKETAIPEGIFVGDFSLGGMTESEARQKIQDYVDSLAERKITLDVEGQSVEALAGELGFSWSNPDAVEEAAGHVVAGNLIEQYMGRKDLEKDPVHIPLETAVDPVQVDAFVQEKCAGLTAEPQNASMTRVDGKFQITPSAAGKAVDVEATSGELNKALDQQDTGDIRVTAVITTREPAVKEEDLETIQDVLGTFSTDFSSSGAARSKNLANGAGKINGHVLMPGETLSGYECMQPFTIENGYYTAAAYENGQVVDSIGGGVCQIATTLYNAALRAELEITQRQNHSMIVTYVKPSMDAAIAGTYKDIKITNNYSTPIYVEGGVSGRTLTFTVYGKETRPSNRKVEYVSETLSSIDPGAPTERPDNSLAPGTRKQVQSAHRGLKSRLWKVVTVDGVETERTVLHTDTYNASKAIILVGPAKAAAAPPVQAQQPAQPSETQPSQSAETQPEKVEGVNGGPGVTAPAQAETPSPVQSEASSPAQTETPAASHSETPAPSQAESPSPAPAESPSPAPAEASSPEAGA